MTTLPPALITPTEVFIDRIKLPGFIADGGVTVTPGGHRDVNRVTVTFLVGPVQVDET